jgi:transposase
VCWSATASAVYDGATALQHKCYAHHLRAWRRARENLNPKQDTGWLTQVRALLEAAIKLRCSAHLSAEQRGQSRKGLQLAAKALLAQPRSDPAEESLRARLWKQRDHLLVFLDHPGVDPTNNLAERQLRPAVIARKLSCGNKTLAGANAWQILTSLAVTCSQRSRCFLAFLALRLPLAG